MRKNYIIDHNYHIGAGFSHTSFGCYRNAGAKPGRQQGRR